MHSIVWFFVVLLAANAYGWILRKRIGYVSSPLMTWAGALVLSVTFAGASLAAAYGLLFIQHDAGIALYAVLTFILSWLGIRYWISGQVWDACSALIALVLTVWHLFVPPFHVVIGLVLVAVALGVSVGGYYATKTCLRILFAVLCAYDIYAVWLSDAMDTLLRTHPTRFPTNPFALSMFRQLEIGTMDIILSAVAVVGIQRHRGLSRSLLFAGACAVSVVLLGLLADTRVRAFQHVPFVLVLAPFVFLGLSGASPHRGRSESAC